MRHLGISCRLLVIIAGTFWRLSIAAQGQGALRVQVVDFDTEVPLQYAKVSLIEIRGLAEPMPDFPQTAYLPLVRTCGSSRPWCHFEAEKIEKVVRTTQMLLLAQSSGYAFAARKLVRQARPEELVISLKRPHPIKGMVRTAEGVPISGAEVGIVYQDERLNRPAFSLPYGGVITDGEGSFSTFASADYVFAVEAYHERYLPAVSRLRGTAAQLPNPSQVDLVLEGGFTVAGKIVDSEGRGIGGIKVIMRSASRRVPLPLSRAFARILDRETHSADDGSFAFLGVPAGEQSLTVSTPVGIEKIMTVFAGQGSEALFVTVPLDRGNR